MAGRDCGDNEFSNAKIIQLTSGTLLLPGILGFIDDVDFSTAGLNAVFTVPSGYEGFITGVYLKLTDVTGLTGDLEFSVGVGAGADTIFGPTTTAGFVGVNRGHISQLNGTFDVPSASQALLFRVITPLGGSCRGTVALLGGMPPV